MFTWQCYSTKDGSGYALPHKPSLLSIPAWWTIRIVQRTIQITYYATIESGQRQFEPWSLTKSIDCRIVTITFKVPPLSLNIECHTPVLNHHRYNGKHIHHLTIQQPQWTWRTCNNNPEASITRGVQCRWSPLFGCMRYSGRIIADCPVLSLAHSIRIRESIGSQEQSWNRSSRRLPLWYRMRFRHYTPIRTGKASLAFNIAMILSMS